MRISRLLQHLGICLAVLLTTTSCWDNSRYAPKPYVRSLEIVKLSDQDYLHISYLKDDKGGYIPCNGFIRKEGDAVFVFDTPINDSISEQLIDYIQEDMNASIKGLLVSHSHIDAAGGVTAFAKANIPTYGSTKTAAILAKDSIYLSNTFARKDSVMLGESEIVMNYFGPGHTDDNVVGYIKGPEILVGGCLIKPLEGTRGNLADANLAEWAKTVATAKYVYPNVKQVIPGHGGRGDGALLDYTIEMFQVDRPVSYSTTDEEVVARLD